MPALMPCLAGLVAVLNSGIEVCLQGVWAQVYIPWNITGGPVQATNPHAGIRSDLDGTVLNMSCAILAVRTYLSTLGRLLIRMRQG